MDDREKVSLLPNLVGQLPPLPGVCSGLDQEAGWLWPSCYSAPFLSLILSIQEFL